MCACVRVYVCVRMCVCVCVCVLPIDDDFGYSVLGQTQAIDGASINEMVLIVTVLPFICVSERFVRVHVHVCVHVYCVETCTLSACICVHVRDCVYSVCAHVCVLTSVCVHILAYMCIY